jgi:hypothetical protein
LRAAPRTQIRVGTERDAESGQDLVGVHEELDTGQGDEAAASFGPLTWYARTPGGVALPTAASPASIRCVIVCRTSQSSVPAGTDARRG